jgi:CheY-like chemotaxis protein
VPEEYNKMGKKILLVDDQQINIKVGTVLLSKLGYDVFSAEDGEMALQIYESSESSFDLILVDYQMPKLDGAQTTKRIREIEKDKGCQKIPIIAMTAGSDDRQIESALREAGIDEILSKPFKRDEVEEILKKYIGE